jgi:cysteine-rich repeat protein
LNLQYHYEVVDYTNDENVNYGSLGPGSAYTTFTAPFTQYRIALFLTSIAITATANSSIHFDITANVIDANTYAMNATLGYNSTITMLQFSQVFFDSSQFSTSSNKYLYFQEWAITNTATTSFFQYNNALAANFMMGLKSFSATGGLCSFEYQWINTWVSSNYGAQVQTSSPYNTTCGFSGDVSTILLMMTWSCPGSQPYFDLTTQMCLSSCNPYTYLNATDNSCHVCLNPTCYTCNALNSNLCLTCATNFVVVSNSCICDTSGGYYLSINGQCYSCSNLQSNCQICSYAGNVSLAYSSTDFTCLTCNAAAGYFIDPNNNCQPCSVQYCTTCIGYVTCSVCQAGYGVTATGACSTCPITGCQTCSNLTSCSVCQTGYIKINNLCYTCPTSCTCGGYTLPKYANGDCSTICGDGIVIFPYEGCDDSNTNNGDGCSSSCQI